MKEDVISLRSEAMARRAGLGQGGKRLGEGERLFHIVRANRWRQLGVWGLGSGVWGQGPVRRAGKHSASRLFSFWIWSMP